MSKKFDKKEFNQVVFLLTFSQFLFMIAGIFGFIMTYFHFSWVNSVSSAAMVYGSSRFYGLIVEYKRGFFEEFRGKFGQDMYNSMSRRQKRKFVRIIKKRK